MAHEKWSGCCNPRISNGASPTGSRWTTARVWRQELEISVSLRILFGPPAVLCSGRGRSGRRGKGRRRWWTVEPGLPAVLFDAPLQLAAIIGAPPSSQVGEQSDNIPLTGRAPSARQAWYLSRRCRPFRNPSSCLCFAVRRWRAGCCTTGCLPRAGEGKSVS